MQHTISGIPYAVRTGGQGRRQALLLHYFGGEGASWRGVMGRVLGLRCAAPDLAGFGATPAPDEPYTVAQHTADMLALIAALQLDDFTLVGHSMGGKIALALAALRPAGLQALVLVAPSPPTPEPMEERERARMRSAYGDRAAIERHIAQITANPLPPDLHEQAVSENLRVAEAVWQAWLDSGSREDISPALARIDVPVTVLVGERDPVIAPALIASALTPHLAGTTARVAVLPGAGHLLPYEAPQRIADVLAGARR